MAKKKPAATPPPHEEPSTSLPTITMADVARILATPDDVLMAWFRKGQEEARRMKFSADVMRTVMRASNSIIRKEVN